MAGVFASIRLVHLALSAHSIYDSSLLLSTFQLNTTSIRIRFPSVARPMGGLRVFPHLSAKSTYHLLVHSPLELVEALLYPLDHITAPFHMLLEFGGVKDSWDLAGDHSVI